MTMAQSPTSQQLQQVKKEQESTQMRGPVAVPTAKRCYVSMATGALAQDTSHLTWWTVCIMVGGTQQVLEQQSCLSLWCARMHACVLFVHACRGSKHALASFEQSIDGHGARGQDSPPQRRRTVCPLLVGEPRPPHKRFFKRLKEKFCVNRCVSVCSTTTSQMATSTPRVGLPLPAPQK